VSDDFLGFPKMARLSRECIVTEKIDGANAQVLVVEIDGTQRVYPPHVARVGNYYICAGSRNRWIAPAADNFGFARWVVEHADELATLGPGRHFGEWWGSGIQRGYGLQKGEKRFSLFNVQRWHGVGETPREFAKGDPRLPPSVSALAPACCHVVPVLWRGNFDAMSVNYTLAGLGMGGSVAAPGFMSPEGIVVFHVAGQVGFKKTLGHDGAKGANS